MLSILLTAVLDGALVVFGLITVVLVISYLVLKFEDKWRFK